MPGLARCLSGALKISTAQKYCRLFINETALLRPIIERSGTTLARDGAGTAQLQRLLRSTAAPAPQASSGLLSELTKREIRILRQLESGLTNKEIAESIFISEGTLKSPSPSSSAKAR